MKKSYVFVAGLIPIAMLLSGCGETLSQEALLDAAANLVINKYENADCEEVAQMQPQSGENAEAQSGPEAAVQEQAMEMLKNNPEMREKFINRVAGPIANKMFECNLVP